MPNYNLSDNVQSSFEFSLRDKKYSMRYPITDEVEDVQKLTAEIETAKEEKREEDVKALADKLENFLYAFISPVQHDTPIKEALSKENIKVMRNFNIMIKAELSIQ